MLTDIFAHRYADMHLFSSFEEKERRFLVQAFRIINEQLYPYYIDGKEASKAKEQWKDLNDRLSLELGLDTLSPRAYAYPSHRLDGVPFMQTGIHTEEYVAKTFILADYNQAVSADLFLKERISFIELAFRKYEADIEIHKVDIEQDLARLQKLDAIKRTGIVLPGNRRDAYTALHEAKVSKFRSAVHELNERFRQTSIPLNYHNGIIQVAEDKLIESQVETPFWSVISDERWKNVETDMKEAVDRRDNGGRNPATYAANALESTIKIICELKGWKTGKEKGAVNYIEHLGSNKNQYIAPWEREALIHFFGTIRNPLGHGPGSDPMPTLTTEQTDWAIEFSMSWIKSLIKRL